MPPTNQDQTQSIYDTWTEGQDGQEDPGDPDLNPFMDEDGEEDIARSHFENPDSPNDYAKETPRLLLLELPDRTPRLLSIEQEVGSGGETLAVSLQAAGHCHYPDVLSYHSENGRATQSLCWVEEDGSVNAEIIYTKLQLEKPSVAMRLESALNIVRDTLSGRLASLDMRCGFHVHVDAKGLGLNDAKSLYHLWNHLEDVIYQLGSANWSGHRMAVADNDYAPPTRKGMESTRMIGESMQSFRGGLNLSNFLNRHHYCRCGACTWGEWGECECTIPKDTIEFRVFNGTANLRKIHAYTALSLALVETAKRVTFEPSEHSANEAYFSPMNSNNGRHNERRKALATLAMLPFTDSEREDIRYCIRNSDLRNLEGSF